jgi:catechol 2,3-dioxygenase-like lactoylglutathione lyase family enzyme
VATQAAPLVSRINVVYLYVRDVERSARFYRDLLGIPLEGDAGWMEARFGDGTRFALHALHEGAREPAAGTVHVNFEVADLDEALSRLRAEGVESSGPVREEWGAAAEVVDPDGYRLYLFEPPRSA